MRPRSEPARALVAALAWLAACTPSEPRGPAVPLVPGVAIAIYRSAAVVDDRRELTIAGDGSVLIDHVDPSASLASLAIDASPPLRATECTRAWGPSHTGGKLTAAPIASDTIACRTRAAPGRTFARITYITPALGLRAEHAIEISGDERATITTRYAVATPRLGIRADLTLYDGSPGGTPPARELARGAAALDGSIAMFGGAPITVPARLRRRCDAQVPARGGGEPASAASVMVLELDTAHAPLADGTALLHVTPADDDPRDLALAALPPASPRGELRLGLWVDDSVRCMRDDPHAHAVIVINAADRAREVWLDRAHVTVPAGGRARLAPLAAPTGP